MHDLDIEGGWDLQSEHSVAVFQSPNDLLVCYIDFGEDKTSTSGDFIYSPHADGIMYLG